jgi:hypothetical protein
MDYVLMSALKQLCEYFWTLTIRCLQIRSLNHFLEDTDLRSSKIMFILRFLGTYGFRALKINHHRNLTRNLLFQTSLVRHNLQRLEIKKVLILKSITYNVM